MPSSPPSLLVTAFALLGAAVVAGSVLGLLHLLPRRPAIPPWLTALHGVLAAGGFIVLILALRGPPRGVASGTGAFGLIAAALLALALAAGGCVLACRLLKTPLAGLLAGVHATLAIAGFVFLTAYLFA